jgi:hypothetical protein
MPGTVSHAFTKLELLVMYKSNMTRRQINRKHKLFQRAKKTNKEEDWEKYREIKRKTLNETRQSHWNYVMKFKMAATAELSLTLDPIGKMFQNASLNPLGQLKPNCGFLYISKSLEDIMKKDIPSKMTSKRHNLPWITHKTRKQINRKHKLFQRAKKTNNAK